MPQKTFSGPAQTAPRYTSYPTAPHFHSGVGPATVESWLAELPAGEAISLYLHVPFCDRLCWFCACHTKHTLKYGPVARFLQSLHVEIRTVARLLGGRVTVNALHFGGGSPTMLRPDDTRELMRVLRDSLPIADNASISVEIDPNDMDEPRLDALAAIGLTRASLGIQDFDPKVQRAINREQSFEFTSSVVEGLRVRAIGSINLDLLYGLPHQTTASVAATIRQALSLRPDRIALFGYAHVPWFKKHQNLIEEAALPDAEQRLEQATAAAEIIRQAGYTAIGIDHFALPGDSLAIAASHGKLRRNFQGYTDDQLETLIGLGPSSVSRFRQGYAQNIAATGAYQQAVDQGGLAIQRGIALSDDDRARAWVIERLMCDFAFSRSEARALFGAAAEGIIGEAQTMAMAETSPQITVDGELFVVDPSLRPLVRTVAARFDAYLGRGTARHSMAV
ncbi:oxygen-independent coproporphyrinogen III oxidase [Pseudaminobacter sp. 19-2017]|uniref:Coproporphyrinogen-III oxidase n=1 Tax=Pseudaminobacter soli (ex Zhang et al. 2022) TaxID=2831468 RepID=A0A942DW43_9HYPH|nr:oxygen-independent coproporphyrinogen III oxidase [Pseudaminobacter soli]MBS3648076.1 oxygen-independent coproporphyrinogen III oxidase [Pseudaminobacter soli]